MVYERLYGPLGGERDDYLAATIASTVAATFSKNPPPMSDFMPPWTQKEAASDSNGPEPPDQDFGYGED
jgi:hypothetical protein